MELDSRIKEGKRPLTCLDVEQAEEFVGKHCLFSDNYRIYKNIQEYSENPQYIGTLALQDNFNLQEYPFKNEYDGGSYRLVLPLDWVKGSEKKWRPYTGIEFAEKFNLKLGGIIHLKNIISQYQYKTIFTGYKWHDDDFEVCLNGSWISMTVLLNTYEYDEDNEWKKFGVEE